MTFLVHTDISISINISMRKICVSRPGLHKHFVMLMRMLMRMLMGMLMRMRMLSGVTLSKFGHIPLYKPLMPST